MNRIEWSEAQSLLLDLVKILSPLTGKEAFSFALNKPFFILPAVSHPFVFQRPICLLTTLHTVQKQVAAWIEEDPENPIIKKEPAAGEKNQPLLSTQAKKLIDQVQRAIGKLCTSGNIQNPKEEPLKEALKMLKPSIDQIVETVSQEEKNLSAEKKAALPFKFPLAKRDQPTKNEPLGRPSDRMALNKKDRAAALDAPSEPSIPSKKNEEGKTIERFLFKPLHQSPKKAIDSTLGPVPFVKEDKKEPLKPIEKNPLPVIPFISSARPLQPHQKLNKKRKRFLSREEEKGEEQK